MRYDQSFCKAIGEWGCYALCIINIAEQITGKKIDKLQACEDGIKAKFKDAKGVEHSVIEFNENNYQDPKNFDVNAPDLFLGMLTGKRFTIRHEYNDILYKPKEGEYIVERWERNGYGHFARTRDGYNSLQDSKCVKLGKLASLRIFKEIIK